MIIDKSTAILVLTAISEKPANDGRYWVEFYPVDEVLALRHVDGTLEGHPLLDIDKFSQQDVKTVGDFFRRGDVVRMKRWLDTGNLIALKSGVRLKRNGAPTSKSQPKTTRRKPEKYLTPDEIQWLDSVNEVSIHYATEYNPVAAMAKFIRGLGDWVAAQPASWNKKALRQSGITETKTKLKAKQRRKLQKRMELTNEAL
jgi:hypothetical protein